MNYEPGDIVIFEYHPVSNVIGRSAEIVGGYPARYRDEPILAYHCAGPVTWYTLIDVAGERRAAAHPWLRKVPPVWTPEMAQRETTT